MLLHFSSTHIFYYIHTTLSRMAASCLSSGFLVRPRLAAAGPLNSRRRDVKLFRVRSSMGEDGESKGVQEKASKSFWDVLSFSGPGPERINGRLAMIGFVAAMGVEVAKGQDIFSQIQDGGIPWFLGTSVVLSLASLVPMFKGVTAESKSGNLMTSDAEIWNGRFAMLGLVALAFTEFLKGGALV